MFERQENNFLFDFFCREKDGGPSHVTVYVISKEQDFSIF